MVGKLCIDSGGTKIKYRYVKESNFVEEAEIYQNGNIFTNQKNILEIYQSIIKKYTSEKIEVLIGAAGAISAQKYVVELQNALLKLENVSKIRIISDIELIAIANKTENDSLLLAFGTGSIGIIQRKNQTKVFGGYGSTFGDQGSGYCFGSHVLRTYFLDYDLGNKLPYMKKLVDFLGCDKPRAILKMIASSTNNVVASLAKEFIDDLDFSVITDMYIEENVQYINKFRLNYEINDVVVFGSITKSLKVYQTFLNNGFKFANNSSLDAIHNYKFKEERCKDF